MKILRLSDDQKDALQDALERLRGEPVDDDLVESHVLVETGSSELAEWAGDAWREIVEGGRTVAAVAYEMEKRHAQGVR